MARSLVHALTLPIALAMFASLVGLAGDPAAAQVVRKGIDYWRTPVGGTRFTFPDGDVESLCKGAPPGTTWNHQVSLRGIPAQGSDWDSAVARLTDARFNLAGEAFTAVQFNSLLMISNEPSNTPCGRLIWTARLAKGQQPVTKMRLTRSSTQRGGTFFADLAFRVELQANQADTGLYVGSLFYDIKLPDPTGGTPWSFGTGTVFRPGMDENNNCIQVLRQKLGTFPPSSSHYYFISNLIAQGKCNERN